MNTPSCPMCHASKSQHTGTTYRYESATGIVREVAGSRDDEPDDGGTLDAYFCPDCGYAWDQERVAAWDRTWVSHH